MVTPSTQPVPAGPGITTPNSALVASKTGMPFTYAPGTTGNSGSDAGKSTATPSTNSGVSSSYENMTSTPYMVNGSPAIMPPGPQLTARVATPASASSTINAPAVITSDAAENHFGNIGAQVGNLNNDATANAAHTAATQAPPVPTTTPNTGTTDTNTQPSPTDTSGTNGLPVVNTGDPQIDALLNSLGSQEASIQTNARGGGETADQLASDIQANQAQEAQTYTYYAGQLSSIASGTYPLSPAETQLLSSTVSSYQQTMKAQLSANLSLTGGLQETLASLGIDATAPMEAQGAMFSAINEGVSKVNDINSQMTSAVAKLQTDFQKQDFDQAQKSWDDAQKYFQDRQTTLEKLQSDLNTSVKDQQTQLQDFVKSAVTAVSSSNKLTFQEKDAALKDLLQNKTLDEKTRHDIVMEQKANQVKQTAQERLAGAASQFSSAFTPGFTMQSGPFKGQTTLDSNGYVKPTIWKAAIADAPAEGMTRDQFIKAFGDKIYIPKGSQPDKAYGLTPVEVKQITGALGQATGDASTAVTSDY